MGGLETAEELGSAVEGMLDNGVPSTYTAAYLAREDEEIFKDGGDYDVRRSVRVGEVPTPELAPDEVVIAVMASSINYNNIWSAMFAPVPGFRFLERYARLGDWEARHDLPYHVIGSDAAGVVVHVGAAVRRWSVGDSVVVHPGANAFLYEDPDCGGDGLKSAYSRAWGFETNFGGLANLTIVKSNQLLPKPRHLTWEEAACNALCAGTAYRMLVSQNALQFKQGEIVLVWGASGGLGSYAIQLIRNGGGIAIGVVGSERKAQLMERLGCDLVLRRDLLELDGLSVSEKGKRIGTEIRRELGEDPHIVFDYVGRETFGTSVFLVRAGGSVVTCGSSTGFMHEFDNRYLWMRVKRIVGSHGATFLEVSEVNRLIAQGRIIPALSKVYPLAQVGEAMREVQLNRHIGKVGVLCMAEREGLGIEDPEFRAKVGEERLGLFREFA
jgi:crotonyl-CoA reductase